MIRVINKLSFLFLKSLFLIKYSVSCSFRCKSQRVLNQFELLSKTFCTNLSNELLKIVINIEDKRYYLHYGHDSPSILRASIHNILGGEIHGASTIEQQLIRIITNDRVKTYGRKFNELLLSTVFYRKYSKEEIIIVYLTNYYFSEDKIGIESFCNKENYKFHNLTKADIIEIVARLKYPNINTSNYVNYLKRVRTIEKIISNSALNFNRVKTTEK